MVSKGNSDVNDTGEPGQLGQFGQFGLLGNRSQAGEWPADVVEHVMTRSASVVAHDELAVLRRENAATAREHAATLREVAIHLREESVKVREREAHERETAVTLREREIRMAEAQGASGNHLTMLQEANAHLVITSIEAQKLTQEVQAAQDELVYQVHHDALTDLPNRTLLKDRLGQAIELTGRDGRRLAIMFIDLDQFKHINDSLGHAVGDQLLKSVARRLVDNVRISDTVSRQSGDEFVLLLPSIEHAEGAMQTAQKVLTAIAQPHSIDGHQLHLSASIGISVYPEDGQDAETLLKHADTAMYHAKSCGRNNCKFFEPAMTF